MCRFGDDSLLLVRAVSSSLLLTGGMSVFTVTESVSFNADDAALG